MNYKAPCGCEITITYQDGWRRRSFRYCKLPKHNDKQKWMRQLIRECKKAQGGE